MRLLNEIEALLDDDDVGVRREVIYFLCLKEREGSTQILEHFLTHENPRLQTAAIAAMAEHQMVEANELLTEEALEVFLVRTDEDAETGRMEVAKLLGIMEGEHYSVFLAQLLADQSSHVVKAAISSVGRKRASDFIPSLVALLANATYRPNAKESLARFGVQVLQILNEHLLSEEERLSIRSNIPSVMARIDEQESVDFLTAALTRVRPDLKFHVVKALNRLRNQESRLKFSAAKLDAALVEETRSYFEMIQMLNFQPAGHSYPPARLLRRALEERLELNRERIFRLLGLSYPPQDIFSAYLGITSGDRLSRANAYEFLENLLSGVARRYLLPFLDEVPRQTLIERGQELFHARFNGVDEGLEFLLCGKDAWLKSCALYSVAGNIPPRLRHQVERLSIDSDRLVKQTAELALSK